MKDGYSKWKMMINIKMYWSKNKECEVLKNK